MNELVRGTGTTPLGGLGGAMVEELAIAVRASDEQRDALDLWRSYKSCFPSAHHV